MVFKRNGSEHWSWSTAKSFSVPPSNRTYREVLKRETEARTKLANGESLAPTLRYSPDVRLYTLL